MPSSYTYEPTEGEWREGGGGRIVLGLGEKVTFRVVRVHEAAGLIALDGSVRPEEEEEEEDKGRKKRKKEKKEKRKSSSKKRDREEEEEEEAQAEESSD